MSLDEKQKIGLWERTKEVAGTYTGTFIVVMILNQLLFFGFCLNPVCIIAAMPHVLLITVAIGTLINKIGKWGDRGFLRKGAAAASSKLDEIGDAIDEAARGFKEEAIKTRREHVSEASERQRQALESLDELKDLARSLGMPDNCIERVEAAVASHRDVEIPEEKSLRSDPPDSWRTSSTLKPMLPQTTRAEKNQRSEIDSKINDYSKTPISGHRRVFITRSRLSSIAFVMSRERPMRDNFDGLYKTDLKPLFTQPELALLSVYREMCANPEEAFQSYKEISNNQSQNNQVFKDGSPAYHANKDCELLHNDYYNLEMPLEIKKRGEAEIERFRAFCEENRELIQAENPIVLKKLEARFFLKNPPTKIVAKNSGVTQFDNMDLERLESEIDSLIFDAEKFRNKDQFTFKAIRDRGYGTYKSDEAKDPSSPLYVWHNTYKVPIKDLLMHFFRVKFNPDLAFDGFLLDQLGFKPCGNCCK